jgi:hypothetical protein
MVWNSDGNIYMRRGGDHYSTASYDPSTGVWTSMDRLTSSPNYSSWGGDSAAFITAWNNCLVYRPGDTRDTTPYISADISAAAFAGGTAGAWKADIGPDGMVNGPELGLRYGDIPKISPDGTAVVCGYSQSSPAQVMVQATSLTTGATLWSTSYASGTGATGFYTSTADYWRFIATDNYFVMFSGTTAKTLRVLNMANGSEKWNYALPSGDDPIMATKGNALFVVGKSKQMEFNLTTGAVVWSAANAFSSDANYTIGNDVIYRPMVLTNSTMWFIEGTNSSPTQDLVGMRTSDGKIISEINLAAMVAQKPGQTLLDVRDMASADGNLAVLCDIGVANDPNGATPDGNAYQDLYVFATPEPFSLAMLAIGGLALVCRRRRK